MNLNANQGILMWAVLMEPGKRLRVGLKTVTNGRENLLTVSVLVFFLLGTRTGTGKMDGKTKSVLRDIGNRSYRSGTCRLHVTTQNI